jgi:gamma-glutamyltranspeptidase
MPRPVRLLSGGTSHVCAIEAAGHRAEPSLNWIEFGCGQLAAVYGNVLLGASDPRMDGYAGGL